MVHIRYANQSSEGPIGLLTTSHRRPTGYTARGDLCSTGTGQERALAPREPAIMIPTGPAVQTDVHRNLLQHHGYKRKVVHLRLRVTVPTWGSATLNCTFSCSVPK